MEHVDGVDLAEHVKRRGPLSVPVACDYIVQVANGLQHAFESGMVHRDIKPQNLMLILMLAPDIQESILMLPRVHEGRDMVTERDLRRITRSLDWDVQRVLWSERAMRFSCS